MGFSVGVREVTLSVAYCNEIGCDWEGTLGVSDATAVRQADEHYDWHVAEWQRQNEEWERGAS